MRKRRVERAVFPNNLPSQFAAQSDEGSTSTSRRAVVEFKGDEVRLFAYIGEALGEAHDGARLRIRTPCDYVAQEEANIGHLSAAVPRRSGE